LLHQDFWLDTGKAHASWCDVYAYGTSRLGLPKALAKKFFLHLFFGQFAPDRTCLQ
jgi:hypothetical protein